MRFAWFVLLAACNHDPGSPMDAAEAPAVIAISPLALDFGAVPSGGASQMITVTVTSSAATARFLELAIDDARFVRHPTTCNDALAAGASCTIGVTFAPVFPSGSVTGHLTATAANAATIAIPLTGDATGDADIITIAPATVDFGHVAITGTASQPFIISNPSTSPKGPLAVSVGGTDAAQFALANDGCANQTIPAAGWCTFDVVFGPTAIGAKAAMVTVTATNAVTAALTGDGIAPPP